MVRLECCLILALSLAQCGRSEDPTERLRNIPPELSAGERSSAESKAQARFLPFSASFSLSAGGNNAHSFSVSGSPEGVGLSQSSSHGSASGAGPGSFSASQSSSIAAGLNGISASDANSFAASHPYLGPQSQAHGNAFSVGEASASSQAHGSSGQASSGAQSSAGGAQSQASSGSQNLIHLGSVRPSWSNGRPGYAHGYNDDYYYHNSRRLPTLTISVNDRPSNSNGWYHSRGYNDNWRNPDYCNYYGGWYRDPRCRTPRVTIGKPEYRPGNRGPYYDRLQDARQDATDLEYATADAASSAQSGPGGFAQAQSSSHASQGPGGGPSLTSNEVQSLGDGSAHAQGASSSLQQRPGFGLGASLNTASVSASSRPGGSSSGSASAGPGGSRATGSTVNGGSVNAAASTGGLVTFPGPSSADQQIIPQEFVRSRRPKAKPKVKSHPVEEFVDELADVVYDAFDD